MITPLLFSVATLAGGQPATPPPVVRPSAVKAAIRRTAVRPKVGVTVVLPSGAKVTTGPGEASTVLQPQPVDYDMRICLQLRAAQPWANWTCP